MLVTCLPSIIPSLHTHTQSFEENVTITPASNEYTFEGLTPYTEYTVNVQAYNDAGLL